MRNKLILIFIILLLSILLGYGGVKKINSFFQTNELVFNQVLKIELKAPVEIKKREPEKVILDYPQEIDTDLEKYICEKWGVFDCKTALAISLAENGTRQPDRFNVNRDGSIDIGIFQINSIHFSKPGCSLAELVIAEKNVDCAFKIWKASGWSPWVTWKNGGYLKHL